MLEQKAIVAWYIQWAEKREEEEEDTDSDDEAETPAAPG
jgi:hypothetical protein